MGGERIRSHRHHQEETLISIKYIYITRDRSHAGGAHIAWYYAWNKKPSLIKKEKIWNRKNWSGVALCDITAAKAKKLVGRGLAKGECVKLPKAVVID